MDLDDVYEGIRENPAWGHLRGNGIVLVPGRGNSIDPIAMIVGGAPSATDNTKRRAFCGPSGRVLTQLMELAGLHAELPDIGKVQWSELAPADQKFLSPNTFITNTVKYRTPGNRIPNVEEVLLGQKSLRDEWVAIGRPGIIIAVGAVARAALNPYQGAEIVPGSWEWLPDGKTVLWVHYHPEFGLRNPKMRSVMEGHWEGMGRWITQRG